MYILLLIILILLSINIKENFTVNSENTSYSENTPYTVTPSTVHNDLLYILKQTDKILVSKSIPYFIDGGTALGQIRHKGFIPWDDDADICIKNKYMSKFLKSENLLKNVGLQIHPWWGGYKISKIDGQKSPIGDWNFPFCDVFPIIETRKGIWHYKSTEARKYWPLGYYKISEIYPLQRVKFENITLSTIHNPYSYLKRYFGKEWATEAFQQYDHETEKHLKKTKFKLKDYFNMPYLHLDITDDNIPSSSNYKTCLNEKVCLTI